MRKGWIIKKLGDVCDFQNGFAFKSEKFRESGQPILRISNIKGGAIDDSDMVYFNVDDYRENLNIYEVGKGDILIAMSGATTGKIGINTSDNIYYLNQRVGRIIFVVIIVLSTIDDGASEYATCFSFDVVAFGYILLNVSRFRWGCGVGNKTPLSPPRNIENRSKAL